MGGMICLADSTTTSSSSETPLQAGPVLLSVLPPLESACRCTLLLRKLPLCRVYKNGVHICYCREKWISTLFACCWGFWRGQRVGLSWTPGPCGAPRALGVPWQSAQLPEIGARVPTRSWGPVKVGLPPSPSPPGVSRCGAPAICPRGRGRLKAQRPSQRWGGEPSAFKGRK